MRLSLLLALVPAVALGAKPKVVLDAPKQVGPAIEKALKAKYQVVKKDVPDEPTAGDVKTACREAGGAIAVITARPGGDLFTVMVLNGADGSPLATFRVKGGKKPVKALPKPDTKRLMEGLSGAKAPKKEDAPKPPPEETKPPPEEKKPEDPKVAEKPAEEAPKKKERPPPSEPPPPPAEETRVTDREPAPRPKDEKKATAVRFGVGFKMFDRRFGYTDDLFDRLSTYYLPRGPALAVDVELFPGAFASNGPASWVGIIGNFDYALGIASRAQDGTKYGTEAITFRAALAGRIPVSILTIQPFFGFARQTFSIKSDTGMKPNIPSVGYNGLRGGLNLRVAIFGPVAFQAGVAGTALLSTGEIGAFFPRSRAGAMDANAALSATMLDLIEIRLGGEYQRYWFSMNPEPGDENIAGGALDIYLSGKLTVSIVL